MLYSHFLINLPLLFSLEKKIDVKVLCIFASKLLMKNDTTFITKIFKGAMYNIKDINVKYRKEMCQNFLFNFTTIRNL